MFRHNDETRGGGSDHARQRTMKSAGTQLTIMLLLVTTLFLILLCPTYVRFIYVLFTKLDTPLENANWMLFFQITALLYISNSGINFFLYCMSGQKFRNDLMEFLCCSFNRRKDQLHSLATGTSIVNSERA